MNQEDLQSLVRSAAKKYGVDQDLCLAITMKETSFLWPKASTRFEPGWKYFYNVDYFAKLNGISKDTESREQATSWGPMQVMGSVARELGYNGPIAQLFMPHLGIEYGVKKLKQLTEKYEPEVSVIAAYNAGSPRRIQVGPGAGKFTNQEYVDFVLARLGRLRQIGDI
jgi:soluble lytic murein transglycosylase-like protein